MPDGDVADAPPAEPGRAEAVRRERPARPTATAAAPARRRRPTISARAILDTLAQGTAGMLLVDTALTVAFADAGARQILGRGEGIAIADGRLQLDVPAQAARLLRLVAAAAAAPHRGAISVLALPRERARRPLALHVSALRPGPTGRRRAVLVAIHLTDAEQTSGPAPAALRELFALSAAEARLAALLATGTPLAAAARTVGISTGTARNHLKRILAKTDTCRQVDLVRLLLLVGYVPS